MPESHRIPERIMLRKTPLRVETIPDVQETARMRIDKPGVGFDPTPYGERIGGGVYGKIYRCRVTKNFMEDLKRGFNAGFIDYVGWGRFYWDGVSGFFGPALEDRAQRSEGRGRR